jgi:hypothetical protein
MSLHNTVCNKPRPVYKCTNSVQEGTSLIGGTVCGTFHLSWEYQIDYVEKRVPKHLIKLFFKLLT